MGKATLKEENELLDNLFSMKEQLSIWLMNKVMKELKIKPKNITLESIEFYSDKIVLCGFSKSKGKMLKHNAIIYKCYEEQ